MAHVQNVVHVFHVSHVYNSEGATCSHRGRSSLSQGAEGIYTGSSDSPEGGNEFTRSSSHVGGGSKSWPAAAVGVVGLLLPVVRVLFAVTLVRPGVGRCDHSRPLRRQSGPFGGAFVAWWIPLMVRALSSGLVAGWLRLRRLLGSSSASSCPWSPMEYARTGGYCSDPDAASLVWC